MNYQNETGGIRRKVSRTRKALLTGSAIAMICAFNPAIAQTADGVIEDGEDRVIITGSRIRGVDPVGSPVTSMGAEEIESSGLTSVDKIIQQLPQVFDLGVSEGSRGQNGGSGNIVYGNSINLRGISPYATLTIIDGHRAISNGRTVDPSILPTLGLERIEILTDGASAVYGSDAVAGVVNLIPKRFSDGGQVFARYGQGDEYDEHQYGISWGKTWTGGQTHLAYEKGYRSDLNGSDRDFFRADQTAFGGNDYRSTRCNPGTITMGGIDYAIPAGGVDASNAGDLVAGTQNLCEGDQNQDLLPEQEYNSVSFTFNQDVNDTIEFVADGLWSKREFDREVALSAGTLTVPTTNAFYVAPTGVTPDTQRIAYQFSELPANSTFGSSENWQLAAGLNFALPNDWRLETLAWYGENKDISSSTTGLNSRGPFLPGALASSDPTTAFDPYGLNRTSPAVLAELANQIFIAPTDSEVKGFEARLDGAIMSLPAGDLRLATGYERYEHDYHAGLARGNPGTPVRWRDFDRSVDSLYAEFYIPLLSPENTDSGQSLEVTVAGRYDNYSDIGSTTNPKFGVNYSPMDGLTFRGSYGTSLRAPIFAELYGNSSALFVQSYSDPTQGGSPISGVALSGGNLDLEPEEATTWAIGADFEPEAMPGAKFSITYWDIEYEGQVAAYLSNTSILALEDQFAGTGIILRDADAAARVQGLLDDGFGYARGVPPNPVTLFVDGRTNNLGRSLTAGIDFSASQTFDLGDNGELTGVFAGTYLTEHKVSITPTGDLLDKKDIIFNPLDLRLRGSLNWALDPFNVRLSATHVGGYTNNTTTPSQSVDSFTTFDLSATMALGDPNSDNWLAGGYTIGLDVRNLLDEDPPYVDLIPNRNGSGGYDASAANPVGRVISASIRKRW